MTIRNIRAKILATLALSIGVAGVAAAQERSKVFFLLPNSTTTRFVTTDAPDFKAAMAAKAPSADVIIQNAEGDPTRQQKLVEDAISQGAKAIVFTSADSNFAAGSLKAAADAKVPVVLYDHDATGGKAVAQVLHNFLAVGQAQGKRAAELINAMSKTPVKIARVKGAQGNYGTIMFEKGQNEFLKPLFDSGKVKVVCEQNTQGWDPANAQNFAEDCLTRTGGDVDMFVAMNDGTAGGAIAALINQGFKPGDKVVTGGQDATVESLRYIIQGWQDDTVFKDFKLTADATAAIVAYLLEGKAPPKEMFNGTINNQFMDAAVRFSRARSTGVSSGNDPHVRLFAVAALRNRVRPFASSAQG
jgi:D-xylose transport system substrate-binding protein